MHRIALLAVWSGFVFAATCFATTAKAQDISFPSGSENDCVR